MQHQNIPAELRSLAQWVVADMSINPKTGKPKKHPINPRTGKMADPTDRTTWGTFEEALSTGSEHIGFVLTKDDPYCIIDLDNKPDNPATEEQLDLHARILDNVPGYVERSVSKTGYHIVCRASVPKGCNRDHVEIYSSARYMIFTGDVVFNRPIVDAQDIVTNMYNLMEHDSDRADLVDHEGVMTDEQLFDMASNAANGDKFEALCQGDMAGYKSQSEADLALLSMFAFYSRDNEQCRRMFRMTELGKREKSNKNDKYLNYTLGLIRSNEPPEVDLDNLKSTPVPSPSGPSTPAVLPKPAVVPGVSVPPGLIGDIAQFIYANAVRPVPEVALVAAITLFAGIVGRSYNVSGSGLNQYFVLVAETGIGKEGGATGMDALIRAMGARVPMAEQFIGPAVFASGQALIKTLDTKPCFVSVLGEFGITLQQICDPRGTSAQTMLLRVLLDIYGKSGWNKMMRSSVYSDSEKNTQNIQAPNVTIFGETTPDKFYDALDAGHVASGLLPRFSVVEYTGQRPPRNKKANITPPPALLDRLIAATTRALSTSANNTCMPVSMSDEALALLDAYDTAADKHINTSNDDITRQLWNRAHLKALKLSALVAVGVDYDNPMIDETAARWAIDMVTKDIALMTQKFVLEQVGAGEVRQAGDVERAVILYLHMGGASRKSYGVPAAILEEPIVPFCYLRRKLRGLAAFKNDKRGLARSIDDALMDCVKADILIKLSPKQVREKYGINSDCYVKGPALR